jgi:hypothetical protein
MSIPTKAELNKEFADQAAAAARQRVEDDVKYFTEQIVAEMRKRETDYQDQVRNVSEEVEQRLRAAFAPDWTLTFHNARTGCYITWA